MSKEQLIIRLLGGIHLELAGKAITELPTRKAEALLVYLVSHERPFSREFLAELLWDDRPQEQALANLRSILSGLRRALKPYLHITRQTIGFNHSSNYWLDVAEFHQFAQRAAVDWTQAQQATDLYRGDFLEGFYLRDSRGFEEWALIERERLQRTAVSLFWQLVHEHSAKGDYPNALRCANLLLQLDNLSERAHRQKMLLLARTGQHNAALQHYELCCQILSEELGVDPTSETRALHAQILTARETPPPQLPPPLPHFVGRDQEQADLLVKLREPACRLLTLLGTGGMGKTRLAIETVRHIVKNQPGQFLHGIWFVPLVDLSDGRLLASSIATSLGMMLGGKNEPAQQLLDFVAEREMLLVLDNFEQLADGAELLGQILAAAPQVKLLVTSQEPLHLMEEWLVDLAGLDTVEGGETAVTDSSAVQLFLKFAQRLHPQFTPSPADQQAINRICRLLQGMPLGIELAAAWIRQFPPPQIAQEIERGLDFLATNIRNVPERHRSLRAVFGYAWQLLPAHAQSVFAKMSEFRGGFTAQAAAAVSGADAAVLEVLVDKSLLRQENGRYTMHPMLGQYAAEQLQDDPAAQQDVQELHAAFYLTLLSGQGNGEDSDHRHTIQTELANVRAAWHRAAAQQQYDVLLKSAPTLHNFYSVQSWFREGIDAFQFALEQLSDTTPMTTVQAQTRSELLGRKARMHIHIGQLEAANRDLDTALKYLQHVDDPTRLSSIRGYAAITAFYAGDFVRATELAQQSLELASQTGDKDGMAFGYNFLGSCAKAQGDYALAQTRFTQAVAVCRQLGDELGEAMVLNNLGNAAQAMGDFAAAQEYYLTCSRLFKAHDHTHGASTTLANAGRLAAKLGNFTEAQSLLSESVALKREMQDERGTAVALVGLGDVSISTKDYTTAQEQLAEALTLAHKSGDVKLVLEILAVLSRLSQAQQQETRAARLLAFVLSHKATAQEVRESAQQAKEQFESNLFSTAQAWAKQQTLDDVVSKEQQLGGNSFSAV